MYFFFVDYVLQNFKHTKKKNDFTCFLLYIKQGESCCCCRINKGGIKMNSKEKMLELIKKKQGGGRSEQKDTPKNDRRNMRKGPKIFNK